MTRKQFLMSLAPCTVAIGFAACQRAPRPASLKEEADRNRAPEFALEDADGNTVKLSELKGKVVLLNFWATWCPPCRIEIPWFVDMEREFKDRGFAVIGVAMDDEGWDVVKPFIKEAKVNYRMVLGTEELAQLYSGVQGLPTSFVIDRNGRIASTHMGIVSRSVFEDEIRALLEDKATEGGA
ncbi:MAG: TlpA family protein disulfide reductase [Bryobacterales bacterium]|jgi:peroxiredoxin|nr:TlpA family protein disulfide reductase [Bryobacterales bacterium]